MNLKEVRQKALSPFVVNINPNIVTMFSLITGVTAGVVFAFNYLLAGIILVSLSGFLDLLDGEIAKRNNRRTKKGDIFDHLSDRIVDAFMFGGIAFSSYVAIEYGLITAIVVLMISYMGTQSQAVLGERLYKGIMGRFPRTISFLGLCILSLFDPRFLYYGIIVILGFAVLTVLERIWEIHKKI